MYFTITTVSLRVFAHVSDSSRTVKSLYETVTVSEVGDSTLEDSLAEKAPEAVFEISSSGIA